MKIEQNLLETMKDLRKTYYERIDLLKENIAEMDKIIELLEKGI